MSIVANVLAIIVAAATGLSAVGKLAGMQQITEMLDHVGVSGQLRQALPIIQLAGAVGILLGLLVAPVIAVLAALGLALYYGGAVYYHRQAGDGPDMYGVPAGLAAASLLAAVLMAST